MRRSLIAAPAALVWACALLCLPGGCDGGAGPLGGPGAVDGGGLADGGGFIDVVGADDTGVVVDPNDPTRDPNCSVSPESYQPYANLAELEALLVRRWKRCIAPQVPGEDVGVEFTADGRWHALTRDGSGAVVRRTGIDYGGTWVYYPPGWTNPISRMPSDQAGFQIGGTYTSPPEFTNNPRQLRILFSPVLGRYLPLDP
jgi:hypothetical protein